MVKSAEDWAALRFHAGQLFTPSSPMKAAELFAGRRPQISQLLEAVVERGGNYALDLAGDDMDKGDVDRVASGLAGAPAEDEIEITPEMIAAGIDILRLYGAYPESFAEELVSSIFERMSLAMPLGGLRRKSRQ